MAARSSSSASPTALAPERMELAIGGETASALRVQAARISACSLKFFWEDAGSDGFERGAIVRSGLRFHAEDSTQGSLWEDRVVLDEVFFAALRDHPVPLLEAAIRQLRDRSMSLDIYVWPGLAMPSNHEAYSDFLARDPRAVRCGF
jgi:hypothetical protein